MKIDLFLIRHGETQFNSLGRMQGSQDSPLTETGIKQAEKLAPVLEKEGPFHDWFVSPQGRARQTSTILRKNSQILETIAEEIQEIFCGNLEGKLRNEISQELLQNLRDDPFCRYPDGEAMVDVMQRGRIFLERLKQHAAAYYKKFASGINQNEQPDTIAPYRAAVISHGNFIRCLGSVLTDLGPHFAVRCLKENTAISHLRAENGFPFRIIRWNDFSHLKD